MITTSLNYSAVDYGTGSVTYVVTDGVNPLFSHTCKVTAQDVMRTLTEKGENVKLFEVKATLVDNSDWI